MTALSFLLIALVVSVVGTVVLWARHRQSDSPDASIDEFNAKMRALSDERPVRSPWDNDESRES